eukprot:TRINITY_DN1078_c0_g1_i1.p1 TRINITY_DN1078_c0_g1~~TRINITY_DN1078_c0_g1_i1.p1  ORF type:complete len:890 (-),score=273.12 TRINITY_DN1078_c0_g1_i1:215-2884(-)
MQRSSINVLALCVLFALVVAVPSVAAKKKRISHSEHLINARVRDIAYAGKDNKILFVLSIHRQLYRSDDDGATWTNINDKLPGADSNQPHARGGGVYSIHQSPADPNRVVIVGVGNLHWATQDGGKSFYPLKTKVDIREIQFHPTKADWFLVSQKTPRCYDNTITKGNCSLEVSYTQDFGHSFKFLRGRVVQFGWAIPTEGISTIWMTAYDKHPQRDQAFDMWDPAVDFIATEDWGKTWKLVVKGGNSFSIETNFVFCAKVSLVGSGSSRRDVVQLMVSDSTAPIVHPGQKYGELVFNPVKLPVKLEQNGYSIVDSSTGTAFLHVNHERYDSIWGNLYTSDSTGANYTISLKYQKRDASGRVDFIAVEGLDGIYLANQVENHDNINQDWDKDPPRLQTVISFDKGGEWMALTPPRKDAYNKRIPCRGDECRLHLHGVTNRRAYGPFYSTKNAVGLIMATGNVGEYLMEDDDLCNTYMSRDAGLTWSEVRKGSHIYEFGDHGSVMVMAPNTQLTDSVIYSLDEGETWKEFIFTDKKVLVSNIINNPTSTSKSFLLYGIRAQEGSSKGVLIHLDFATLGLRECEGVDAPGSGSDFELWIPETSYVEGGKVQKERCLMGRTTSYVRRKQDAKCFNGENLERTHLVKNCPCTAEDYECYYGHHRASNGKCVPDEFFTGLSDMLPPKDCPRGHTYLQTKGYQRVGGNTCVAGVSSAYEPIVRSCGRAIMFGDVTHRGAVLLMLVFVACLVLGALTVYAKVDSVRMFVDRNLAKIPNFSGNAFKYEALDSSQNRPPGSLMDDDFNLELDMNGGDDDDMDAILHSGAIDARQSSGGSGINGSAPPAADSGSAGMGDLMGGDDLPPPSNALAAALGGGTGEEGSGGADGGDDFNPRG